MILSKQQKEKVKKERTGEINYNNHGSRMKIKKYIDSKHVIVEFENKFETNTTYTYFQIGNIKSPYDKTVCNIGYIGEGKNKSRENGKMTQTYQYWQNMLQRCYSDKFHENNPTYIDCSVCEEWLCYQTFATWFEDNYYSIDNEKMCLDKDILVKGNKIYSPDTCCIVPSRINNLFCKTDDKRGELPIGVYYHKGADKYAIICSTYNRNKNEKERGYLGLSNNSNESFKVYKQFKEKTIKEVAEEYKNLIPTKLYNALYSWVVEITD